MYVKIFVHAQNGRSNKFSFKLIRLFVYANLPKDNLAKELYGIIFFFYLLYHICYEIYK